MRRVPGRGFGQLDSSWTYRNVADAVYEPVWCKNGMESNTMSNYSFKLKVLTSNVCIYNFYLMMTEIKPEPAANIYIYSHHNYHQLVASFIIVVRVIDLHLQGKI